MTEIDRLSLAKNLLEALENGDEASANKFMDEIAGIRETQLYQEVGKLTRQLHDSMTSFALESKITAFAQNDIPDAKERLHYVISMTEQAANKTLNAVEDLYPVASELNQQVQKLSANWDRFLIRQMPFQEFKDMSQEITEYFKVSVQSLENIQNGFNEILMAQSFQDITGQIIRRVITMVEELESGMLALIKLSGHGRSPDKNIGSSEPELPGPVVPGLDDSEGTVVASSQDDVDDLLSSLGF
ncbi:MAG: protein phosphatase CheZ [Methylicorpusculum sp.]|uniref:protein phosphatase CheZ n=1 Tax=Methylicorpusculum sp. TaxID=2713644 RepID=UPI0027200B26|nr:protein phosphatase CheZ [Methylicorpusculum sp.]MDO8937844.1 protein phosphatase CheZ [Methylicorpusculum sp.]MDP2202569.1 protein phosphatase CheZ [Methylicorpusculum sp.]